MAVTNEKSTQMTKLTSVPKQELSVKERDGRVRIARFDHVQGAAAGDIGSTADLFQLPAGARILGNLSWIKYSAFGVARTLSVGTRAHRNAQTGAVIAESAARLISALAVDTAGKTTFASGTHNSVIGAGVMVQDQDTVLGECTVFATVAGGTWPAAATESGDAAYVVD